MKKEINVWQSIVDECLTTKSDVYERLGYSRTPNSRTRKSIEDQFFERNGVLMEDFLLSNRTIERECPICKKIFTRFLYEKPQTTCSPACRNTHFYSDSNHWNWNQDAYRSTCFEHHKHECVVCGENRAIDVHHLDENKNNNHPNNLIPLCPTHHRYWHTPELRKLVEPRIMEYRDHWLFEKALI